MKKLLLFTLFILSTSLCIYAQEADEQKDFDKTLSYANAEQAIEIYTRALQMSMSPDKARKKAKKLFKKLSPEQQEALLKEMKRLRFSVASELKEKAEASKKRTTIAFRDSEFNFGEVMEGEIVKYRYKFTNTGKQTLYIAQAKASCGCTVPEWPKEGIEPGESGEILVAFNTKGKLGQQSKRVTITANTEPLHTIIVISGEVKKQ